MFEQDIDVVSVALPVPLRKTFEYAYLKPSDSAGNPLKSLTKGTRVLVPFGRQTLVGVVLESKQESDHPIEKLKAIKAVIDDQITLPEDICQLLDWAATYYQHPIGEVYATAIPTLLRSSKVISEQAPQVLNKTTQLPALSDINKNASQLKRLAEALADKVMSKSELKQAEIKSTTIKRFIDEGWAQWQPLTPSQSLVQQSQLDDGFALNPEQAIAVAAINNVSQFQCFLLDGITGSGKTEVYLQTIAKRLLQQQQVMVLVPEIGLTPQTIKRFEQRFNVPIALWHSGMTDKQRFESWYQCLTGEAKILIATRSGVFVPFANLGLIVIDEEHDASFKQQEGFKYHCRSLALYRAAKGNIPVILGSATPSLETLNNALSGKYHHLLLRQRATGAVLPEMKLVDLNRSQQQTGLGQPLIDALKQQLALGKQVMLFINRRGFAPVLMCEECHWMTDCHRCSGFMTYHKGSDLLICHHCGNQHRTIKQCMSCGSTRIVPVGHGTEQIQQSLTELFPEYPVVRLDRDSTAKKGEFEALLNQIQKGEPQVIVGTQMIAKGHHFPNVTLVGIVDVDGSLFSSDFRAAEKLSQLVVQVAGRAGRGSDKGSVWLQSKFPEHPVIQDLLNNQYEDFAKFALSERKMLQLPPYSHQVLLKAESTDESAGGMWLQGLLPHLQGFENLMCLGPMPAPMNKKAGKYRYLLQLQCQSRGYLHKVVDWLIENLDNLQNNNKIRWSIDVDPYELN